MGAGFDVWLMGFKADAEDPVGALADAFGLDHKRARRLVASLPKVVKRGLAQGSAVQYADALRALGAKVEVRAGQQTASYPKGSLPRITGFDPSEDDMLQEKLAKTSGSSEGTRPKRATLGDGPEGTREAQLGQIVSGGNAPYAWLTYSLMGWVVMLGGAAILGMQLWLRANPFFEQVGLPDVLISWVGGTLASAGLIEGLYGVAKRRTLNAKLPMAVLWLGALVGVQMMMGSPLFG